MPTYNPHLTLNNGVEMPALGLGVYQCGPDETVEAVRTALDEGYRLIDTAAAYQNEEQVGRALRESDVDRSEVFVTTKLWISDYGSDEALRAYDRSLDRLGLEAVDLYLLHQPMPRQFERTVAAWEAAEQLLGEGRVRAIGVSNFSAELLDVLVGRTDVVPAVNQVEVHPYRPRRDLVEYCHDRGIRVVAHSPLSAPGLLAEPTLAAVGEEYGLSPAEVVLAWNRTRGIVPIPSSTTDDHIVANLAAGAERLDAQAMTQVDALADPDFER